ncbi:MAG: sugar ABC transporter permease [Oscillospiraceae bacterium]|nr:sugar ABC transporter permease [Oscillospiraceae bacterium]
MPRIERVYAMDAPAKGLLRITGIIYFIFVGITAMVSVLGITGSGLLESMRPARFVYAQAFQTHLLSMGTYCGRLIRCSICVENPYGFMPMFLYFLIAFALFRLIIAIMSWINSGSKERAALLGLLGKIDLWIVIPITAFTIFAIDGFSFIWFSILSYIPTIMLLRGSAQNDFRLGRADRAEARAAKVFLIPAFLGLTLVTYIPLASVFGLSLFDWRIPGAPVFGGFVNYIHLFTENFFFWPSIRVTIIYAFLTVVLGMFYSMVIALLLNRKMPGRSVFRTIFYLPFIIPVVASFTVWRLLYSWQGPINSIVNMFGGERTHFLNTDATIIPALAIIAVWASGNIIVIKMAGLGNVPRTYQEAAEVDGANAWQRFWNITIPCMTPIIFYNMLMSLVTHMQVFVPSMIMGQGGSAGRAVMQESYLFMTFIMYREGFMNSFMGRANAIAFIFFILVGFFTAVLFATSKSWLFYEGGDAR